MRSSRRRLRTNRYGSCCALSQASTPLQSLTTRRRESPCEPSSPTASLLPRFPPLRRFSNIAEPPNSSGSLSTGYVASSGFRNLSTLCSPRCLPGLFHPESTLGVLPSRPSPSADAVRSLKRRTPHEVGGIAFHRAEAWLPSIPLSFEGLHTVRKSRFRTGCYTNTQAIASLGFSPPRPITSWHDRFLQPISSRAFFLPSRKLTHAVDAPEYRCLDASRRSLELRLPS